MHITATARGDEFSSSRVSQSFNPPPLDKLSSRRGLEAVNAQLRRVTSGGSSGPHSSSREDMIAALGAVERSVGELTKMHQQQLQTKGDTDNLSVVSSPSSPPFAIGFLGRDSDLFSMTSTDQLSSFPASSTSSTRSSLWSSIFSKQRSIESSDPVSGRVTFRRGVYRDHVDEDDEDVKGINDSHQYEEKD